MFFFAGVRALATVASCYGRVQEPGGLLRGRRTKLRLVLELAGRKEILSDSDRPEDSETDMF